jgi:hypothetical protein
VSCVERRADGSPCYGASFVFDPQRRGMLCREHALAPLQRLYGQRPDLEEKAELTLRLLSLPSQHRHEILESLTPADRREFIELAGLFRPAPDQPEG